MRRVVQFAPLVWDSPTRQRPHHLALGLARLGFSVTYVDPGMPAGRRSAGKNIEVVGEGVRPARRRLSETLRRIPGHRTVRHWIQSADLYRRFREMVPVDGIASIGLDTSGIALVQFPYFAPQALALKRAGWKVIYDRLDPWRLMPGVGGKVALFDEMLYARADAVVCTTEALRRGPHGLDRGTTLVPNGVDLAHFGGASGRPDDLPSGKPIAGYVGTLDAWFDWERLAGLARARADWNFVLIGPGHVHFDRLPSNVVCLGPRTYERLPAYVRAFSVGLIPFRISPMVAFVDPVKAYEYLAAGVPVVAVPFPSLKGVPGVHCSEGAWDSLLDEAAAGTFPVREVNAHLQPRAWENLSRGLAAAVLGADGRPTLSVVVPNFNGGRLLKGCLRSIGDQKAGRAEVILVDDASTDGSVDAARNDFPWVAVHQRTTNGGFARAANDGIRAASGEFVALLNNDTVMAPDWSEKAMEPFADPDVGAVASLLVQAGRPDLIDRAGDGYTACGAAFNRLHGAALADRSRCGGRESFPEVFGASGAAVVFRRRALVETGLFDETFGAYYEDVDLAWRLRLKGWKVVLADGARGTHVSSATYRKGSPRFVKHSSRNSEVVFWTDLPLSLLVPNIPDRALYLAIQSLNRLARGELLPYLVGKASFAAVVPELLSRRRRIQGGRTATNPVSEAVLERRWFVGLLKRAVAEVRARRRRPD